MEAFTSKNVTLDLWDTVLRRRCHPDEVKIYTAQRMIHLVHGYVQEPLPSAIELFCMRQQIEVEIGDNQLNNGYDDEYEIVEVLETNLRRLITLPISSEMFSSILNTLVQGEIDQEKLVTFLDRDLIHLLQKSTFENLYIVSDFYMSAEKVESILSHHSFPFEIDRFFISCDCKLNKRSGRLFDYVCKVIGMESSTVHHIGDNKFADFEMSGKAGMQPVHFSWGENEVLREAQLSRFQNRLNGNIDFKGTTSHTSCRDAWKVKKSWRYSDLLYNYGLELGVLFVGFSLFIQERCLVGGHKNVHFFTREGRFFKEVFDQVQSHCLFGMPSVESKLLPVSRLASFFPSLNAITINEMMRLWSQYHTQSLYSFLNSLGVEPALFNDVFRKREVDPHVNVERPWESEKFLTLFSEKDFLNILERCHGMKRHNLIQYFKELDFGHGGKACIVDIGWRGTIQDNIAHIFPDIDIDGCYLGLQNFFNPQPVNTSKYGYLADANKGEDHVMLSHVMPYEMLCFSAGGSAVGYSSDSNGKLTADFRIDEEEDHIHNRGIIFFQEGVIDAVKTICDVLKHHAVSLAEVQEEAKRIASNFLLSPPHCICDAFNTLKQDDTFGMSRTIFPGKVSFRLTDRILSPISVTHRKRFLRSLDDTGWPQCALKTRYYGIFHLLSSCKNRLLNSYGNR